MSRRALIGGLVLATVIATRPVRADADADADADHWPRWQRGYALVAGAAWVGGLGFSQIGAELRAARRIAPGLWLGAAGELIGIQHDQPDGPLRGEVVRARVGLEWDLRRVGPGDFLPRVALVGGAGSEVITWDRGLVVRPLAYGGVEMSNGFRIGRGFLRALGSMSFRIGTRVQLTPAVPARSIMRVCTGCTPPADPPPDLSLVFVMGLDLGGTSRRPR